MKSFYLRSLLAAFILIIINQDVQAQHVSAPLENRWFIGGNMGGTWQTSDADKNYAGLAGGFTIGKYFLQGEKSVFDFGLRFRYLAGSNHGKDYHHSYGLQNNVVLNGTIDSNLNYQSNPGYYFHNYRMKYGELDLELMIGLNKLRRKTGILLYVFGGIGGSEYQVTMDQKDALGNQYNYANVDTSDSPTSLDVLNSMWDGDYETTAETYSEPKWHFTTSLGVGLGVMLGRHAAIGMEYKVTFPLNDLADGKQWTNANVKTGNNDYYHYAGGYFRLYLGGRSDSRTQDHSHQTDPNNYTNNNNNNTNPPPPPPPQGKRPVIRIMNPPSSPFTTNVNSITVSGTVDNINNGGDLKVKVNGVNTGNFTYNSNTRQFSIFTFLNPGQNTFEIKAVNPHGSDLQGVTVIFDNAQVNLKYPPIINIVYPTSNPYTSPSNSVNVSATVQNVASRGQLAVIMNGANVTNFNYDVNSKVLSYVAALNNGVNTLTITATTLDGSDTKTLTLNYSPTNNNPPDAGAKPIVTMISPNVNPYNSMASQTTVTASIINITSQNQISVSVNNKSGIAFTWNSFNKTVTVPVNLFPGMNTVVITATNNYGSDAKSVTINFVEQPKPMKPVVDITYPNSSPFSTNTNSINLTANVSNVDGPANISLTVNGTPNPAFNYNPNTDLLTLTSPLVQGSNVFTITATNNAGMDSKSTTVIYTVPQQVLPPTVTITKPTSPNVSDCNVSVMAKITGVSSPKGVTVKANGQPMTNFIFNVATGILSFNTSLTPNASANYQIIATNQAGNDSKSVTFTCPQKIVKPVISIVQPQTNPFTSPNCQINIVANTSGVNSQGEVSMTMNGNPVTNFAFNPNNKQITFNAPMPTNATYNFTITVNNANGSDSKNVTIVCSGQKEVPNTLTPPVITVIDPNVNPYTSGSPNLTLKAKITNITSINQVTVKVDFMPQSGFSYDAATKTITGPLNLSNGSHSIEITASNSQGMDQKTITINVVVGKQGGGGGKQGGVKQGGK